VEEKFAANIRQKLGLSWRLAFESHHAPQQSRTPIEVMLDLQVFQKPSAGIALAG
jgi:hypothetical protein